ncbi:conserved Plasmodium protein, unknown function [Plasmodium gonderi]|uniref:DUF4536 domain-containing protein n=1 Tax=Plasmodium gonderi TaxID=77519 RepID=A0A1Y1JEP0_PLAGO|nr:conserved Plasmodium protein, unknown function [Plasmodium gonderi]GAW80976.1 conserved Plasmodium protein, unknown function [Plasmodium gonderi]
MNNTSIKKNTDDCIFCRITGTVVLGSVSIYSFIKYLQAPRKSGDRRFFAFISLCFCSLSIYRAVTPARSLTRKENDQQIGD